MLGSERGKMGLLNRLSDLLRSNINDLISRAEDPEKMLNAAIEEMQKQLVEAKSRVAMSIADEKRLEKQQEQERSKAEEWEHKAMTAVRAGRDDLAVEALARKKEHESASEQFQEQLEGQRGAVDELKRALTELTSKLDETRRKRTLLLARAKRAEAQKQIASTLSAKSHVSASERLERLEARIERDEARAEAQWEFASLGPGSYERDLAKEIEALGTGDGDEDLEALKAKVRELDAGAEQKALAAGSASSPETHENAGEPDDGAEAAEPESGSAAHGA
ncbi:MAG: PspA/IM30 family protein [Myxococcota bacterium]